MQYMLLIYNKPSDFADAARPDHAQRMQVWSAYSQALVEAGAMVGGNALHPPHTATTVRLRAGQRELHDGPYAEAKEQLGGYYLIEAPTLDAALQWAARCPAAATGAVEVRPIVKM
jgi:hypothetical protein